MKQIIFFLLTLCLCSPNMTAETITGSCGDNVTYSLDTETGVLTISGSGAMADYIFSFYAPWSSYRSQIQTATIEDGVTNIGERAFSDCSDLTNVTIGEGVMSIGEWAFCNYSGLTGVIIPNSVTSIGSWGFYWRTGLREIHCQPPTPQKIRSSTVFGVRVATCKISKGTVGAYQAAEGWREFANIIEE